MKLQEILVAHPSNADESKTLKTLLKALKIKFEVAMDSSTRPRPARKVTRNKGKVKSDKGKVIRISPKEKNALDEGLLSIKEGRIRAHDVVTAITRKKFPTLF